MVSVDSLLGDLFNTLASQESQRASLAESALSSGLAFYQKKDYARAIGEFMRAIALDPTSTDSFNYLANSYLAQNKTGEAIKAYKQSLAVDSTQDSAHTNLANIYLQKKEYALAEKEYKEAIKLNPGDTVAPYTLGQLYLQTDRYREAEAQFKKVQRMVPRDANPYYSLGLTYSKEGKYQEAVKELTQAVKLRPKMAAAHLELGIAYAALGESARAKEEVSILSKLDKTQGELLRLSISKPKMIIAGGGYTDTFNYALDEAMVPLWKMDGALSAANTSKEFRLTFYFDSEMDPASVQDVSNWTMSRASGGAAGYYNNLLPVVPTEAYIPQNPFSVAYDPETQSATVTFLLSQNSTEDATIDPSHVVFKFSGKDIKGKTMDPTADEFDGDAGLPF